MFSVVEKIEEILAKEKELENVFGLRSQWEVFVKFAKAVFTEIDFFIYFEVLPVFSTIFLLDFPLGSVGVRNSEGFRFVDLE